MKYYNDNYYYRKYAANNIKQSIPALYHTIFLPTLLSAWTRIKGVKHLAYCCARGNWDS